MAKATPRPGQGLLTPADHVLLFIDHQPQMAFATRSIDNVELRNNAAIVAEAAKIFDVAHILTSVAERTFSGPLFPEILATFPAEPIVDRTTMNCWEDERITSLVNASGCGKVVVCGLWTSVCIVGPALSALDQGFDVYVIADACGDVTTEAHELAMTRMAQAGAHPMTSLQYLLELQRDWARAETYDAVTGVARTHGGGYGLGLVYASAMLGGHASEAGAQAPAAAAAVGGRG